MIGSVTCIIPAYRAREHIAAAVGSAVKQTRPVDRIVVVDDGSDDGTRDIAEDLAATDKRIIVITQPNGGVSAARNVGIKAATGDWVAFLDADDQWDADHLETFARSELADASIYSCGSPKENVSGGEWLDASNYIGRVLKKGWGLNISGLIVARAALPKEPFRHGYRTGEDVELVLRLIQRDGKRMLISNAPTISLDLATTGDNVRGERLSYSGLVAPNAVIAFCDEELACTNDNRYRDNLLALRRRTELSVIKSLLAQRRFRETGSAARAIAHSTRDRGLRRMCRALAMLDPAGGFRAASGAGTP